MAQSGFTPILIYGSTTTGNTPSASNLTTTSLGVELAINATDGKLFYKDNSSTLQVIGWKTTPTTAGGTGLTSYTAGDLPYYSSGSALSKLGIGTSGYVLQSNGSAPTWVAQSTLTVGNATNAVNVGTTDNTSSSSTYYPTLVSATSGNNPITTSSTKLSFVPNTGTLTATVFSGSLAVSNLTGTTLPSTIVTSSLTTVGTIGTGTWQGTKIATGYGGTGLTSFTSGGVLYASSTSALTTGSALGFDGTNLLVGTSSSSGSSSNTASVVSGIFSTASGSAVPASGVATTVFTAPSLNNGMYIVTANISGQAPPTYQAVSLIRAGGTTLLATSLASATSLTISVSGENIQVTQNSGGTNGISWTVTRLS